VNTTLQGVTNGLCSLQEAIYSSEFKANIAVGSTNPDTFYTTGCEAGTAKARFGGLYLRPLLGWRQPQRIWADGYAGHFRSDDHRGQWGNAAMDG